MQKGYRSPHHSVKYLLHSTVQEYGQWFAWDCGPYGTAILGERRVRKNPFLVLIIQHSHTRQTQVLGELVAGIVE